MLKNIFSVLLISVLSLNLNEKLTIFFINQSWAEEGSFISEPVRTYPLPYIKPSFRIDLVSIIRSKRTNKNNIDIHMSHKGYDPYACEKTKINHNWSLDINDKRNTLFINRTRINRWYSVSLACSEQPMNFFEKGNSSNYKYLENCYIVEYKSSKKQIENLSCYSKK